MLCEGLFSIILRRGVVGGARPSTWGGRIAGPLRTVRGLWCELPAELPCELPAELPWELPAENSSKWPDNRGFVFWGGPGESDLGWSGESF